MTPICSKPMGGRLWALILSLMAAAALRADSPSIEYDAKSKSVAVRGLAAATLRAWRDQPPAEWTKVLGVFVGDSTTPMLGTHAVGDDRLLFTPRFPLEPGLKYRVVFQPRVGDPIVRQITLPKSGAATTDVAHVYPTGDRLPENQLKFYLHFSAPMRRGEAYSHVSLVDDKGVKVDRPFLELGEELWDPSGQRFTLFLHPGRIKRGLKPREELGPPLVEGRKYTLVVDQGWRDSDGNPLKREFRKSFLVVKPDDVQPDPKGWKIEPPRAGARTALVVKFPEPLDHALLRRMLWIVDAGGARVPGEVETKNSESAWHFTPAKSWHEGDFRLVVDIDLEDLAGNSIRRPFEVDEFRQIDREIKTKTVELRFSVK